MTFLIITLRFQNTQRFKNETRRMPVLINGNLKEVLVIPGVVVASSYRDLLRERAYKVCDFCKRGLCRDIDPKLQEVSDLSSARETYRHVVEECLVDDVLGFMIPSPYPVKRTSCLMVSNAIPIDGSYALTICVDESKIGSLEFAEIGLVDEKPQALSERDKRCQIALKTLSEWLLRVLQVKSLVAFRSPIYINPGDCLCDRYIAEIVQALPVVRDTAQTRIECCFYDDKKLAEPNEVCSEAKTLDEVLRFIEGTLQSTSI